MPSSARSERLAEQGVDVAPLATAAEHLRQDGATAIFMGVGGKVASVLAIADPVTPLPTGESKSKTGRPPWHHVRRPP
jgi:hypothetical protein